MMSPQNNGNGPSPQIICFSSGKGGVGKTSLAVNIATSLAQQQKKVLVVDADLGLANVDIMLGLNVKQTVREALEQGASLNDILVESYRFSVLPASSGVPEMANLSYEDQVYLTSSLESVIDQFEYVLVDCAAGIHGGFPPIRAGGNSRRRQTGGKPGCRCRPNQAEALEAPRSPGTNH